MAAKGARLTGEQVEIRIRGRLSESLLGALGGLQAETHSVETVLYGELVDSAALHGILDRVEALGLELIEVRRLPSRNDRN